MKPLLRVVLIVNALIAPAFGLLFLLRPWAGLFEMMRVNIRCSCSSRSLGSCLASR